MMAAKGKLSVYNNRVSVSCVIFTSLVVLSSVEKVVSCEVFTVSDQLTVVQLLCFMDRPEAKYTAKKLMVTVKQEVSETSERSVQ